ncbi:MAG: prolyl oligopeptidase family serine peptidase [Chloroflexota bacterium]
MTRKTLPYGSWPSPISVDMAVGASRGLSEPRTDGADLYFLESRPLEAGRVVLMRRATDGSCSDVVPADLNVRTRVHEYGGGAYAVQDGIIAFSEFAGNRLMLKRRDGEPRALTSDPALRFADMEIDSGRDRVIAVLEDQRDSDHEARNLLCAVSMADGSLVELETGHDFYSDPRVSPDRERLAWLSWDHPRMPWDGTDLWVANIDADGTLAAPIHVAGGPRESIAQPRWAPDGSLLFFSDSSDWWNLYRWRESESGVAALAPMDAEFAGPQWVFGLSDYGIDDDGTIVASAHGPDGSRLLALAPDGPQRELQIDATSISDVWVAGGVVTLLAGSPTQPARLVQLDLGSGSVTRVRDTSTLDVDVAYLSTPRHIEFPSSDGRSSHAWYYPPANPEFQAPAGEAPPLVVMSHGGPTSSAKTSLSLARQAFTSRGFAVVDVDYGGSSGYGRAYRDQLHGTWGLIDVDDCANVAIWLVEQGLADRDRLAIRGGSAGGFTTLAALCFRDVFSAGTSFYGVADLEALKRFTHKFESHYLDWLVAPYPEQLEIYRERSPIHHVDGISCPLLVMQGADDLVVPQAQADEIVAALERKDLPHAYLLFEGEGHGFRRAVNQRRALEAELSFYAQVFGFDLADDFERLDVRALGN